MSSQSHVHLKTKLTSTEKPQSRLRETHQPSKVIAKSPSWFDLEEEKLYWKAIRETK
jgi:hypothetical protein